jgi:ADP-heptose:LPS heptosyltransferase
LESLPGFRIGINWQGNPKFRADRFRSMPLTHFAPLAKIDGVRLVSLQRGPGVEQLEKLAGRFEVTAPATDADDARSFVDTAAIMKNLDLVVTSDTSIAHLAGALGVRAFVAVPFSADWRWMLARDDSPWYPTLRLFRPTRIAGWDEVFSRIAAAVADVVKNAASR